VVAEGTPEEVAGIPASHTGKFLREILGADRISDAASVKASRKKAAVKTVAATTTGRKAATARTVKAANNTATKKAPGATAEAAPVKKATRARKA
jgi:excinuclease ABC subunit A